MLVSIEALAMAGVDYMEWGMDIEESERDDEEELPPPHLLADDNDEEEEEKEEEFMKVSQAMIIQKMIIRGSVKFSIRKRSKAQWRSTIAKIWFYIMSIYRKNGANHDKVVDDYMDRKKS